MCTIMLKFRLAPSSAGVERLFSSASLTQTKIRNRLSNEQVHKLILIHRHFGCHMDKETGSKIEGKGDGFRGSG